MRFVKKMIAVIAAAICFYSMSVSVCAHDVPDMTRKGTITVTMRQEDTVVAGGILSLYQVGIVREDDGNYDFALNDTFAGSGESLDEIQSEELAKNLAQYVQEQKISGVSKEIDANGTVTFEQLNVGLYLVVQDKAGSGYFKTKPFLVSIPYMKDGVYQYEIDASPKVELFKDDIPVNSGKTPSKPSPSSLPQTGQLNWPIPILVITGLLLFSMGWMLRNQGKKCHYAK